MDRYQHVYAYDAATYEQLISAEDAHGHARRAVVDAVAGARHVVDVGAGTGRLTRWLLEAGHVVTAVEPAAGMRTLGASLLKTAHWCEGEAAALPLADHAVDAAVEGWALGHVVSWEPEQWEQRSRAAIAELVRVVRPGGTIMLLETAGTCVDEATPPPHLLPLYALWTELGFHAVDVATDYVFASLDEAVRVMGAFFGDAMAARVRERGRAQVPEFTRIFRQTLPR